MERKQAQAMEEPLYERLKRLVKEQGLTQKELAERAHLTEASVSKYLSGYQQPHLEVLVSLAKVFDVSMDYLVGLEAANEEETYQKIYASIKRNKGSFSSEEKMKLIALITSE
jgi:transcriptional regulator with XRE-family HTH domain